MAVIWLEPWQMPAFVIPLVVPACGADSGVRRNSQRTRVLRWGAPSPARQAPPLVTGSPPLAEGAPLLARGAPSLAGMGLFLDEESPNEVPDDHHVLDNVCDKYGPSRTIHINPRPAGGGGGAFERPPLRFFEDSEKTAARSAAGFSPTLPPSFPQLLWKFGPNAMWGQVTRSGQVTQLQNNFPIAPRLQCFKESYETFGIWWGHQCLQNVYLGFLISVS